MWTSFREKRVPTRQITGYGVPSGVARIDDEATFGVLDQPAKNRPRTHPELVEKNVQLALQCRAAIGTALLREFELCGSGRNGRHFNHLLFHPFGPSAKATRRPVRVLPPSAPRRQMVGAKDDRLGAREIDRALMRPRSFRSPHRSGASRQKASGSCRAVDADRP